MSFQSFSLEAHRDVEELLLVFQLGDIVLAR